MNSTHLVMTPRDLHRFRSPNPPTIGGVYWHERKKDVPPVVVRVVCGEAGCRIERGRYVENVGGRWTGPLPTPDEIGRREDSFWDEVFGSTDWAMMPITANLRVLWWSLVGSEKGAVFRENVREGRTVYAAYHNAKKS